MVSAKRWRNRLAHIRRDAEPEELTWVFDLFAFKSPTDTAVDTIVNLCDFFFLKFEVCALVLSIVVFKYDSYDKYRQTIWETFKILSLYIQNATLKCEKVEDKMWVRHWKFCDLIPLEVSLHLKGINESILKVVKDLFGWCW